MCGVVEEGGRGAKKRRGKRGKRGWGLHYKRKRGRETI
jgi:hypothetical protein